jgi:TPP-dependent 2-oxoacid decarboxylase
LTIDSILLDNPRTAAKEIDRVLWSATRYKRPVYVELPRDMISIPIYQEQYIDSSTPYYKTYETDTDSMQEALGEAIAMINSSKQPGIEIHRCALQDKLSLLYHFFQDHNNR